MEALTLSLTVIPSILIALFVVFSDRFREPTRPIVYAFLLGFIVIIPAGFLNIFLISDNDNLLFIAGFTEEPLKFLTMYIVLRLRDEFNEPMDAIVYGIVVSLGFALNENYDYVYNYAEQFNVTSWEIALARSYSAIPMHAACGVIMGFYFGQNYFIEQGRSFSLALIVPIIIHGSYNFLLSFNGIYPQAIVVLAIIFCFFLHRVAKQHQSNKNKEHEDKLTK